MPFLKFFTRDRYTLSKVGAGSMHYNINLPLKRMTVFRNFQFYNILILIKHLNPVAVVCRRPSAGKRGPTKVYSNSVKYFHS